MTNQEQIERLIQILEQQFEACRNDNYALLEKLVKSVDTIISNNEVITSEEFQNNKEKISMLYQNILLALTAEKDKTDFRLKRMNLANKVLNKYKHVDRYKSDIIV